jgi:hypothetical protein
MPIQPGLALQVKGLELPDPLAMQAQATQIQNALQQQRMGEMQIQNAMREQRRKGELEKILGGFGPEAKAAEISPALVRGGFLTEARTLMQSEAQLEETRRKAQEAEYKGMISKADLVGRVLGAARDQDSFDFAIKKLSEQGIFKPADVQFLGPTYDPARVKQILDTTMSQKDRLETAIKERTTAATESQAATAAAKLPFERQRAEAAMISARAAADRQTTERKPELQRLQELRDTLPPGSMQRAEVENVIDARGRSAAPTLTDIVDPDDPTRMLKVDARLYTGGGFTAPGVVGIAGKEPSAGKRAAEQSAAREQFLEILDTLQASFDELNRRRAIPSEQRGAVSNFMSSIEASGPGQVASRAVGAEAQTIRDRITASRMTLLSALSKLTGKTSSQLNSNVELRLNLDALSNPSENYEAAIQKIDDLKRFYAQEPAPTPSPGGRPGVTDRRSSSSTTRGDPPGESKGVVDFGSLK